METALNVTMSGMSGLNTFANFGSVATAIIIFLVAMLLLMIISNESVALLLLRFARFLKRTFGNFAIGIATIAVLAPIYWLYRVNAKQISSGNPVMLKWLGIIIACYIGISIVGWIAKACLKLVIASFKKARRKK
jgi:uncharacterized membrane protein